MRADVPIPETEYRRFKGLLFGDAVSDWTGVYEAWWTANSEFPELALSERLHLAEAAVAELIDAGHIELYRGTWSNRPGAPIPRDEYDAVLSEWATWAIPNDEPSMIWMGADEPADAAHWQSILDSL